MHAAATDQTSDDLQLAAAIHLIMHARTPTRVTKIAGQGADAPMYNGTVRRNKLVAWTGTG
jgi:hypothetical protein